MKQVEDKINYTMEVYNPVLKVWSSADAPGYTGAERMPACCAAMILHAIRRRKKIVQINKTGEQNVESGIF